MTKLTFYIILLFAPIFLQAQPDVDFTVSKTKACVGEVITITSTSTPNGSPIVNYIWSAQGADTESAEGAQMTSFSFVYTNPGTYNLGLIVQDQNGLASNEFKLDILEINANPQVQINSLIQNCSSPFLVNYNASGSTTGAFISYHWNFPGGNPATHVGDQVQISYQTPGVKILNLTVVDGNTGCQTTKTANISLEDYRTDFEIASTICLGSSIQLSDLSSLSTNQWLWSSPNASFINPNVQNPQLTFTQTGNQFVKLISTNTLTGCMDSMIKVINVLTLPNVSFVTDHTFDCAAADYVFTNTSTPISGSTFTWNFDDGSPSFSGATPPMHTYLQNNVLYFPTLTMLGTNGCTKTFIGDTIYQFDAEAYFNVDHASGCAPVSVQFTDQSFAPRPITNWFWDFGDGTNSTLQNPQHVFACGVYDVQLVIQLQGGCTDTVKMSQLANNQFGTNGVSILPDFFQVQVIGDFIFRFPFNDFSNDFVYQECRYGELLSTDFTFDPPIQCGNRSIEVTSLAVPSCIPQDDIEYHWTFEGFFSEVAPYVAVVPISAVGFHDTLKTATPMDIGLEIDFRGCISPRTDKVDVVYLKAPISRFGTNTLFCNEGPGPHTVFINDSLSIYGHINDYMFMGSQVVEDQADDDVEVNYQWGDGTSTFISDDTQLEDADKGSTSHTFPSGYGSYVIRQTITNHTTGCADSSELTVFISFVDPAFEFDIPGDDTVCLFTPFTMTQSSTTFADHLPLRYTFIMLDTTYVGTDPQTTFPSPNGHFETVPGTYDVILNVRNKVNCQSQVRHPITNFALPISGIQIQDDTVCKHSVASFSPASSQFGDYQLSWSQFYWTYDSIFHDTTFNLNSHNHFVEDSLYMSLIAVDGFGCVSRDTADTMIYTQIPLANFTTNPYLCNNVNELLNASSSTGNGTLTYSWFLDGTAIGASQQDSLYHTITVTPPDLLVKDCSYRLIVSDNKGCLDTLDRIVTVSNPRIESIDTTISAKYIDADGFYTCPPVVVDFELDVASNWPPSGFQWSFGNDFDTDIDSYNEDPSGIQYVRAGSYDYFVEVTESVSGCVISRLESPYLIIGGPSAEILVTLDSTDQCGLRYLFQILNASDNLDRWEWDLDDGSTEFSADNPANSFYHTYLDDASFEPVITLIDDSTNCIVPVPVNIQIEGNGLNAFFTADPLDASLGTPIVFDDQSTSVTGQIVSWVWDFGDQSGDSLTTGESQTHLYLSNQSPLVVLTITDEFGCTDQYKLPLILNLELLLPNIITDPGGNGVNSVMYLFANIFRDFEILIVNRWGNVVYEGKRDPLDPLFLWGGIDQKSGKPCVDGTYFYVIQGVLIDDRAVKYQSFVTLVGGKY